MPTKKSPSDTKTDKASLAAQAFAAAAKAPSKDEVRNELIIFWDAPSPLSIAGISLFYGNGGSIEDIGIGEDVAIKFINKYNSLILRAPGKGPLVTTAEARGMASTPMEEIVDTIYQRAQP